MPDASAHHRYDHDALLNLAFELLVGAGMPGDKAVDVADSLIEGELLGRSTHGLRLLPWYLDSVRKNSLETAGTYEVVRDESTALVWDGRHLPGPWLVKRAIAEAERRLARYPVVTIVVRRSHHTAALQSYLREVVEKDLFVVVANSDRAQWVAPHGAVEPVMSPSPLAVGFPTDQGPVMIDMSAASTAYGQCRRAASDGVPLAGQWVVDAEGNPSDDPTLVTERKGGAILPLGGLDLGYKGFALGLMLEAWTNALGGHGRDGLGDDDRWSCSVFVQLMNPSQFSGLDAFKTETGILAQACRSAKVPEGKDPVHLPGELALRRREDQITNGVSIDDPIIDGLRPWATELEQEIPEPLP